MWKEKVLDVLSDISDLFGVLREITVFRVRRLTKYEQGFTQMSRTIFGLKVVETNFVCNRIQVHCASNYKLEELN